MIRGGSGQAPPYQRIFETLQDGVVALDAAGRIVAFNAAAARILGIPAERALGATLADLLFDDPRNDAFIDALLGALHGAAGPARLQVPFHRGEERLSLTIAGTRLEDGEAPLRLAAVISDETEIASLRESERDALEKLRLAYRDLDAKTSDLERSARRLNMLRIGATAIILLLVLGLGLWNWGLDALDSQLAGLTGAPAPPAQTGVLETLTVTPQPVEIRTSVVGRIQPGRIVQITAPFNGHVKTMLFEYGTPVREGSVILEIHSAQFENDLRAARAAYIRAAERVRSLEGWRSSTQVTSARRHLTQAEQTLASLKRKLQETRTLYDKGIVSRQELDSAEDQASQQELSLAAARESLEMALDQGRGEALELARLELASAKTSLEEIEAKAGNAIITAPVNGVPFQPSSSGEEGKPVYLEVGAAVQEGSAILSIGDLDSLTVETTVDEVDVAELEPGQPATVTGDAFPGLVLEGEVSSVAAQAKGGGGGAMARFDVEVAIDELPPEAREAVRVGMSANVSIRTYANPEAIVLPLDSVQRQGRDSGMVRVIRGDPVPREQQVRTGRTVPAGVEILSGLREGDVVVLD